MIRLYVVAAFLSSQGDGAATTDWPIVTRVRAPTLQTLPHSIAARTLFGLFRLRAGALVGVDQRLSEVIAKLPTDLASLCRLLLG
jgi:hypothetical protein